MKFPSFFDDVAPIRVRDPLSELLGATADGVLEYTYADTVRLAGHSCPTVAGAYALTRHALASLFGNALPTRGGVRVDFAAAIDDGVTGVVASVVTLITGAAGIGGFKGLGGQFVRRDRLAFTQTVPLDLRFTRLDSGAAVDARADTRGVPADPEMMTLLPRCLDGTADAQQRARFGLLWQNRVKALLIDHADDRQIFQIRPLAAH